MISSVKRAIPFLGLLTVLGTGILLTPMLSGCSKKDPKAAKTAAKKKKGGKGTAPKKGKTAGKPAAKTASAKAAVPALPTTFSRLTSCAGIPLDVPFEMGETEVLLKVDPAKGISVCETERLPGGKITLNTATQCIVRIEMKKQYETDQEAAAAFEERKKALEKSTSLPPIRQMQGVAFSEILAPGKERSILLIRADRTVYEVFSVSPMPKASSASSGKAVQGLFGLELGRPIPEDKIDESGMMLFYPDYPREEFKVYNYFSDGEGNVQAIMAKSDPQRTIYRGETQAVARWLEEKFAMKMSYEGEGPTAGVYQYAKGGRMVDLRWKDGKLTLSVRILTPERKN